MNSATQKGENKMIANTTITEHKIFDITDVSDAVLDAVLNAKMGETVEVENLSRKERFQVATLMGWDTSSMRVINWCCL